MAIEDGYTDIKKKPYKNPNLFLFNVTHNIRLQIFASHPNKKDLQLLILIQTKCKYKLLYISI